MIGPCLYRSLRCQSITSQKTERVGQAELCLTVYPKKYAHGFVVLCFVMVMQSFIMNSHEVFIHIHQVCFAGTGAIVRLPQCQWSKPDGYGIISQCITTTKHSKAKTVCIFLGIYCTWRRTQMPVAFQYREIKMSSFMFQKQWAVWVSILISDGAACNYFQHIAIHYNAHIKGQNFGRSVS